MTPLHPTQAVEASTIGADKKLCDTLARLRASGLRVTRPRTEILNALLRAGVPLSIEAIHDAVEHVCDLVTVYRSTTSMHEIGLLQRLFSHAGAALFTVASSPEQFHVIARSAPLARPIDSANEEELATVIREIEDQLRARGYRNVGHLVEFFAESVPPGSDSFQL